MLLPPTFEWVKNNFHVFSMYFLVLMFYVILLTVCLSILLVRVISWLFCTTRIITWLQGAYKKLDEQTDWTTECDTSAPMHMIMEILVKRSDTYCRIRWSAIYCIAEVLCPNAVEQRIIKMFCYKPGNTYVMMSRRMQWCCKCIEYKPRVQNVFTIDTRAAISASYLIALYVILFWNFHYIPRRSCLRNSFWFPA